MSSRAWRWLEAILFVLAAIFLGILFAGALNQTFLFFTNPITGTTRQAITIVANLICLAPLLVVLLSGLAAGRFGWQAMALTFFLPIFVVFAYFTLVFYA
jgi:hypothetical protein